MNDKGLGVRLLLADDDRPTRIMLRQRISDWGYEIEEADNGQSALEILTGDDPPRMAVLDWIMPGLDGVEVCQRVASRSDTPFIYTILLTRRSEKEDLVQALDSGAHDFLTKPVDIDALLATVASIIGGHQESAPPAVPNMVSKLVAAALLSTTRR